MDYEKIGKFIALRRKEKNMTQKDLAMELKITDRAVSRWERGIGCPDISLLESLAQILDVSILEILHGESIKNVKNENNALIGILAKNKKKIHFWKTITFLFFNMILVVSILSFIFLFVFPERIQKSENKRMYSIVTESMSPSLQLYDEIIVKSIDIKDVQIGDIITYVSNANITNGYTVTHRVVDKRSDSITGEIYLETKGDNNYDKDEGYVTKSNLIGVLEKRIPELGRFLPIKVFPKLLYIFNILLIVSLLFIDLVQVKNFRNNL